MAVIALATVLLAPASALAWDVSRVTTDRVIGTTRAAVDASGHRHIVYDSAGTIVYLTDASGRWTRSVIARDTYGDADIAVTPSGAVHVVFVERSSDDGVLMYATRAGTGWTTQVIAAVFPAASPAIAVTAAGVPHVAWSDAGVRHAWLAPTGTWSIVRRSTDDGLTVDIALGPDGHPHLAWDDGSGRIRVATDAAGSWTTTTVATGDAWAPRIVIDAGGASHLAYHRWGASPCICYATDLGGAWQRQRVGASSTDYDIAVGDDGPAIAWTPSRTGTEGLYLARLVTGSWLTDEVRAAGIAATDPSVALLADGRAVVTHREYGSSYPGTTTERPGIHSAIEAGATFPDELVEPQFGYSSRPTLALAPDGSVRLAYAHCDGGPSRDGVLLGSKKGPSWTWTRVAEGCATSAALAIDGDGHAHVAWLAAGEASYATDTSGSWMTTAIPASPDGWTDVAIALDRAASPLVVVASVYEDTGLRDPELWSWRPGDATVVRVARGSEPSAVFGTDGPVIGAYGWFYGDGYLLRRPEITRFDGSAWTSEPLAAAGRSAVVAADPDARIYAAFVRLGAPAAYLATGEAFPDALAASAAAVRDDGFVLLTRSSALPAAIRDELKRSRPEELRIAGGTSAVSPAVEATASRYAYSRSYRLSGADRYATAVAIAYGVPYDCCSPIYVASGTSFPDALAGSALAGRGTGALLLTTRDSLPAATAARISSGSRVVILGGPGAVSTSVEAKLRNLAHDGSVERIAGADRYATAAAIARRAYPNGAPVVYLATGEAFPDGLAAGPAAAQSGGPLLLTRRGDLPSATRDALLALRPTRVVIVGGTGAVSGAVGLAVKSALPSAKVVRVAGADRYETAAALSRYAFPGSAGLVYRDLAEADPLGTLVSRLTPDGLLSLAAAADGTLRVAFAGPASEPGIHLASRDAAGRWAVQRVTRDPSDHDPSVVIAGGRTYIAYERGWWAPGSGIFLAAE